MLIAIGMLLTLVGPLNSKAECLAERSKYEASTSFSGFIQDIAAMASEKMYSDNSENLRIMQNATAENTQMIMSTLSDQSSNLLNVIEMFGTMQNSTSVNFNTILSYIREQSVNTDSNIVKVMTSIEKMLNITSVNTKTLMSCIGEKSARTDTNIGNVIDVLERVSDKVHLWWNGLTEFIEKSINSSDNSTNEQTEIIRNILNETVSMIVQIYRENSQMQNNATENNENNSEISLLRDALVATNNVLSKIENNTAQFLSLMERHTHRMVPLGFIEYDGHIILLPTALSGTPSNWMDSVNRCKQHGAVPFIPRTVKDFKYLQSVNVDIGGSGIWLPASDAEVEGVVKWFDGSDAKHTLTLFTWHHNNKKFPGDNDSGNDCVNIWTNYNNELEMDPCSSISIYPMVCEKL